MLRAIIESVYESLLRRQINHIPRHVAIIQDGNRRYAKSYNLDTSKGHNAGADRTEKVLNWVHEIGITHISLYSFSTENFERKSEEVDELFRIFKERFQRVASDERFQKNKIHVKMVGDRSLLPSDLLNAVNIAEEATKHHNKFFLYVALAYGGRNEIVRAARKVLTDVKEGKISRDDISESLLESHLHDGLRIPPVDLIIRTGNELRTSNFLPWLANGNECAVYFCAPYWPLFRRIDLMRAVRVYSERMSSGQYTKQDLPAITPHS